LSKRTTYLLIAVAVFLSAVSGTISPVLAGGNQISLWMNGELMSSVYAVLEESTTVVDLEALCDALGFGRTSEEKQVTVTGRGREITVTLGEGTILMNGCKIWVYPEPRQEDGRILIPIRLFMENMGYRVQWVSRDLGVILSRIQENAGISITTRQDEIDTEHLKADLQWPYISGLPSESAESLNKYFRDRLSSLIEEGRQAGEDLASAGLKDRWAEIVTGYRVMSNESGIVSILLSDYIYSGGAHGMTIRTGVTLNAETGQVYRFKDLFKAESDYEDIVNNEIKRQMKARGMTEILLAPFETINPDQEFYIQDDNLVIFFDLYEYTPYAFGFPEFRIPLTLLGNVLSDEFAAAALPLIQESQLKLATADWLRTEQSSSDETLAFYALIDLNNDGLKDGLVLLGGPNWTGSGGSTLLVFEAKPKGQGGPDLYTPFEFVSRTTLVNPPIVVGEITSNGWKEIYVYVSGGGAQSGWVALRFDGSEYPLNPSIQERLSTDRRLEGVKVFLSVAE
jgi:hypothetical protein